MHALCLHIVLSAVSMYTFRPLMRCSCTAEGGEWSLNGTEYINTQGNNSLVFRPKLCHP